MRRVIPTDILAAAEDALVTIVEAGLAPSSPVQLSELRGHIATALLSERERLQTAVIAAVADEPEACRNKVFAALRSGSRQ